MSIPSDAALSLRRALADRLKDSAWRDAVASVPRELFLGEAVFRGTGRGDQWKVIRREDVSASEWLRLVYQDETWVTQVNGLMADEAAGRIWGTPTSSSTMPTLVVKMLAASSVGPGEKILEIGTGTGYSTALMCHRLGDGAVTSIEYDPVVAARARAAITAAGCAPTLVVGDGLAGYEKNAEYDRLIATCSVRYIPIPWLWQVRNGGTVTAPLWGWMGGTAFAHLTLDDMGNASGRFLGDDLYFMAARAHLPHPLSSTLMPRGEPRQSRIDPNILDDETGLFVAQLAAPSAQRVGSGDETILVDVGTGSQAATRKVEGEGWTVCQHGPLRLWDAVEDAIEIWQGAGSPHQSGFGLTATPSWQRVWLGDIDGPSWNLPA
ncbi:ATP-grasp peptide maturase system methyltransferase [Nonomuraea sp. NEAU-A123]|uniref:ATP-grasp peptide maturase system methyltransferase n=1 Tax=Nonomuraea sp. NEAU-A123 TaxID=2839649 RepID=UPI001BE478F1|nr:ATP-grasp peptide maturase system methyltransferase [Nonomuraea sp. NEAU-A123]MBT2228978.1 ATP-grasp peptide maturase system methyltransferase [Nonomuraea sp. NEAU-A123]